MYVLMINEKFAMSYRYIRYILYTDKRKVTEVRLLQMRVYIPYERYIFKHKALLGADFKEAWRKT